MPHQPLLSSLVVRPSDSNGGGGGAAGGGSDYEPGEVRRDPPPYSRSERFSDNPAPNVAWFKMLGLEEGMLGCADLGIVDLQILGLEYLPEKFWDLNTYLKTLGLEWLVMWKVG